MIPFYLDYVFITNYVLTIRIKVKNQINLFNKPRRFLNGG